jgi:hypothetical protein
MNDGRPADVPGRGTRNRRQPCLVRFLFLDGPLGRRQGLEALIRDRLAAFDGEAVRSGGETRFGALERVKVFAQVVRETLVELVLVEVGSLISGIVRVRRISGILVGALRKRTLDPLALGSQQLTCPLRIHRTSLLQVVFDDGLVTRLSCVRVEPLLFQGASLAQEIPASVQ